MIMYRNLRTADGIQKSPGGLSSTWSKLIRQCPIAFEPQGEAARLRMKKGQACSLAVLAKIGFSAMSLKQRQSWIQHLPLMELQNGGPANSLAGRRHGRST